MNRQEKVILYGLVVAVVLLIAQNVMLQNQITTFEQDLVKLEGQIPEALDYTATGAISNVIRKDVYVVNKKQYQYIWNYEYNLVKDLWNRMYMYGYETFDEYGGGDFNATLVVAIHYNGFNGTEALNGIDAIARWEISNVYYNDTMSESIIGDFIEFTYSPFLVVPINSGWAEFYLRVGNEMPEGEYTILAYLRAL